MKTKVKTNNNIKSDKNEKKIKKNDNDNVNYFVNSLTLKHCKRNKILN